MINKINTYEKLGRFVMNLTYNILLGTDDWKMKYPELKRHIQVNIANNPYIDKEFAMHKYNHGTKKPTLNLALTSWEKPSTEHLSTYRWENVLYYYIMQHQKAAFMELVYYEDKNGVHDFIALRKDCLKNDWYSTFFCAQPDMNYMFDKARLLNGKVREKLLKRSKNQSLSASDKYLAEYRLIQDEGILSIYKHSVYERCG